MKRIAENGAKDALAKHGGGPHDPGMDERVIRLEEWAKHSDQRMGRMEGALERIESRLDRIDLRLAELPTKRDLTNNTFAGLGIGLALMALIIGGIIGGLSYIKPDSPAPTPPPPVTITAPPPQIIYMQPPTPQVQQPAAPKQ
ncbi:hypothetical protein M5E06_10445 [Azospirillum sp. A1-3]|uniref:hypothetical protein n=1 Tax=Azospirillum sp. A1-3 TaxID=185874 RepID=UPI00207781BD|nr:hypothetical protein [Azospirillum sp. A1-3]MCM8734613.1 hypothetical protein [Azospirillum sp. A1-3]